MEGWAIQAKKYVDSGEYEKAEKSLRDINTQGRRLEWRGGERGLKHLPDMEEVKALKKKVTEARVAAQQTMTSVKYLERMGEEKKGSSKDEHFARERKIVKYKLEITKSLAILIEVTKQANKIVKDEPWFNPTYLTRKENSKFLQELFQIRGYYKHITSEVRFEHRAKFIPLFKNGFFKGAYLFEVDLSGLDILGANLEGAKGLTKEQLHSAKNWQLAKYIPLWLT